uniref:Costars domain-containing protein n=1 Tax=Wuchereria bancrofti TaxID=6293 RepID=A0AAF5PRB3_WUCBA
MRLAQQTCGTEPINDNDKCHHIITTNEMVQNFANRSMPPSKLSSNNCGTIADDFLRKFSNASVSNSQNPNITRKWELRSLGRRETARDAINLFSSKDNSNASSATDNSNKLKINLRNKSASLEETNIVANGMQKICRNRKDSNISDSESECQSNLRTIGRSARDTIKMFNNIANETKEKLDRNPFSSTYTAPKYDTSAQDYGRPTHGSKTEARGIRAGDYVMREVLFLCEVINKHAEGEPPNRIIRFGPLFYIYAHYSDKLVGMLIRARKYKLVDFEGEMLYQRQDDDKIIRLLKPIEEIRKLEPSGDPVNCISVTNNNGV